MIQITDIGGDKREFYRPVRLCNTQHALKGQKLLAQGSALGIMAIGKAPCKGVWDKHSKEEYDNRLMGPNATNMGANATIMTANATIVGANATIVGAKKRKKTAEKG